MEVSIRPNFPCHIWKQIGHTVVALERHNFPHRMDGEWVLLNDVVVVRDGDVGKLFDMDTAAQQIFKELR